MHKLIRWKYVLPRLAVILVVALICRFCLDGVLRCAMVASGEAALGAKVEIGELTTALAHGEIFLRDLAAANPSKPMKNIAVAAEARLQIDVSALLHKQLVVTDGEISGLEFDTHRVTSGALEEAPDEEDAGRSVVDPILTAAGEHGAAWLDNLTGRLEQDLTEGLQTPQVAQELQDRWPGQYAELKSRVDGLKVRGKEIETSYKQVKSNPLRNLTGLDQLQSQLAAADEELKTLTQQINGLPTQIEQDRQAIDAARRNDEQFIRRSLDVGNIDGEQLSRYLLESETSGYLVTVVEWTKYLRKLAPAKKLEVDDSRSRGVNVLFVDRLPPKWLVRRLSLSALAHVGGQSLKLSGALTDASSDQRLHGTPMRLALDGSGAFQCEFRAEIDRTGEAPRDLLTFDCPQLAMPSRTIGKPEKFAVTLAPGNARVQAELVIERDQLAGTISLFQSNVAMTANIRSIRDAQLAEALSRALKSVDHVEATVNLAGTIDRPKWDLESDLGPQLAAGMKAALGDYLQGRADRALAKTGAKVDEQLAKLDAKRQAAQQDLLGKLGENQKLLAQLGPLVGGGDGRGFSLPPQLGKLPSKLLKR